MTSVKGNISLRMDYLSAGCRRMILIICSLMLLSVSSLWAQEIKLPERPSPPRLVNDYAGMLSPGDADQLESKLVNYSNSTSTQIAVVIISDLNGADRAQYATELMHAWGIGMKDKDNGILLLISRDDRKMFLGTGRGVEEFLPDAICKRITEQTIKPRFKDGDYVGGINAGVDEIQARLTGQFKAEPKDSNPKFSAFWIIVIIIGIIILFSLFGGGGNNGRTYSSSGSGLPWFLLGTLMGSGGGGRSSGGSWGGGDSGGFGGFGGGDSGGGGAGSDW